MKKEDREIALNPTQFRKVGSTKFIDLRTLDETDEEVYNTVLLQRSSRGYRKHG